MSSLLLSTKLQAPQLRPEHVQRAHLVSRLQEGLVCKLILISAPAGYGKTTLLCEWLAACKHPSAWISLDKGDNDPAHFWAYVQVGLQKAVSSQSKAIPENLYNHDQSVYEALLTNLINGLNELQQPLILVLDDYHNIETQSIHDGLSYLLDHAPPNFHIAISTRADPPLPLARLRAHSQLLDLRLADLRFTTSEINDFLRSVMSLDLPESDLSLLESSTEGWIAGLQMAGLSLQGREDAATFIRSFSGENRYILDFLFEEVFQRQSKDIQDFLLRTSVLEQFCESLCNAVTLKQDSQAFLANLECNNLFLVSLDEKRKWYRYHHLFADLLRHRLKQILPFEITVLHQRASAWYADQHDLENAIEHALVAEDFKCAARLLELIIKDEEVLNKLVAIRAWMEKLPATILEVHPWLCVYRAWVDFETGFRETAEERLQAVEKSIETTLEAESAERQHIQGHIAALRAYHAFPTGDISQVLEMGERALHLLPADDRMRSSAGVVLGAAYWAIGDVIQAEQSFRMARDAGLKISLVRGVPATCYIGMQQVKQGRLQEAMDTFQDALHLAMLPDGNETLLAGFPNAKLGDVYRERNDLTFASKHLNRGVEQSLRLGQVDVLSDAYVCLGRYLLALNDFEQVQEILQKADRMTQQSKVDQWILCWLDDLRLRSWLTAGNLEAANRWARNSGLSPDDPLSYQHDLHHQNLARVLVAQSATGSKNSHEQAATLLKRLRAAADKAGWVHEEIRILIMQAMNYQSHNNEEAALRSLGDALLMAEPGVYIRTFIDEGKLMEGLLKLLVTHRHDNQVVRLQEYTRRLLSEFNNSYGHTINPGGDRTKSNLRSHPGNLLVEPLSVRETEVLSLLAQGCSDKNIAEKLFIARGTVHKHLKNIYGKLGVHSRTEALVEAHKLELL